MPVAAAATYLLSDLLSHFLSVTQLDLSITRRLGRLEFYGLESDLQSEPVRYVACVCNVTSRAHAQSTICVRPLRFVYKGWTLWCHYVLLCLSFCACDLVCVCVCACVHTCMRACMCDSYYSHSVVRHLYISTPDAKKMQLYIFAGKTAMHILKEFTLSLAMVMFQCTVRVAIKFPLNARTNACFRSYGMSSQHPKKNSSQE